MLNYSVAELRTTTFRRSLRDTKYNKRMTECKDSDNYHTKLQTTVKKGYLYSFLRITIVCSLWFSVGKGTYERKNNSRHLF